MISELPVEIILMTCDYLNFESIEKLAWTTRRNMQIVRRNLPMALESKVFVETLSIDPVPNEFVSVVIFFFYFWNNSQRFIDNQDCKFGTRSDFIRVEIFNSLDNVLLYNRNNILKLLFSSQMLFSSYYYYPISRVDFK